VDEECDIAVATLAQLLLHEGNVVEALKCFERAAELSRTMGEVMNALQYAEATRTQLEVSVHSVVSFNPLHDSDINISL
jgi:mitochondrial import receptor subunit TOM70